MLLAHPKDREPAGRDSQVHFALCVLDADPGAKAELSPLFGLSAVVFEPLLVTSICCFGLLKYSGCSCDIIIIYIGPRLALFYCLQHDVCSDLAL